MNPGDSENARFEELMAREFPDGLVPSERARPLLDDLSPTGPEPSISESAGVGVAGPEVEVPPAPTGEQPPPDASPPGPAEAGFRTWEPDDEPDEPFVPPSAPPMRRWSVPGLIGTGLVLLPLVLVLLAAFGLLLPMLLWVPAGCGFLVGVVLLLQRLRKRPPIDGDGAVL